MKLPEKFIPQPLIEWLDRYSSKRIKQLQQQQIKLTWQNIHLQNAVNEINSRQTDKEKAPSDV